MSWNSGEDLLQHMLTTFPSAWYAANVPYKLVISKALIKQNYSVVSSPVTTKTGSQSKSIKAEKH